MNPQNCGESVRNLFSSGISDDRMRGNREENVRRINSCETSPDCYTAHRLGSPLYPSPTGYLLNVVKLAN